MLGLPLLYGSWRSELGSSYLDSEILNQLATSYTPSLCFKCVLVQSLTSRQEETYLMGTYGDSQAEPFLEG